MSTRRKSSVKSSSLVHEKNASGQHRIIKIVDGVSIAGNWAEHHSLATLGVLRAAYSESPVLPEGIFTVAPKDYTRL